MNTIFAGRYTARLAEPGIAVFLIGMRINNPLRVDRWLPVAGAMPKMLKYLAAEPESGLLSFQMWFGRTTLLLSYWRSAADLVSFAGDSRAPHAEAWRAFNRRAGRDGTVGVWHETYVIRPGQAEAIYANMPAFGLAAATAHEPVTKETGSAMRRLGASA